MSLNLVLGDKKSGKTTYLCNLMKNERDCVFLVPEQRLFDFERYVLDNLGEEKAFMVNTLSFKKLAEENLREDDSFNIVRLLDRDTKNLIIEKILIENQQKFKAFKNACKKSEFAEEMSLQISEFKRYLITPDDISRLDKNQFNNVSLSEKLDDILLIYREYEKSIKDIYSDSDDMLTLCGKRIIEKGLYNGKKIFIDGFTGFTGEEIFVIKAFLLNNCDVFITLPYTKERGEKPGSLYYTVYETKKKLEKTAKDNGCDVNIISLCDSYFTKSDIEFLKENLYSENIKIYGKKCENIIISGSDSIYNECEKLTYEIVNDIKNGARAEDMAVIVPDSLKYEKYFEKEFGNIFIPYFCNTKIAVYDTPVASFLCNVFRLLSEIPKMNVFLNLIKSGYFMKESPDKISRFENFLVEKGVSIFKLLKDDFSDIINNKKECGYVINNEEELYEVYNAAVLPLKELMLKKRSSKTPNEYSESLYEYFVNIGLSDAISKVADDYYEAFEFEKGNRLIQVYNYILESMERCSLIFKNSEISFDKYKNILISELKNKNIASVPAMFDCVTVCDSKGYIGNKKKYVYVLGANEGQIPKNDFSEGIINESEREILSEFGISMSMNQEFKILENRLIFFNSLTSAEEKIYISYLRFDENKEEASMCDSLDEIKEMFGIEEDCTYKCVLTKRKALENTVTKLSVKERNADVDIIKFLLNDSEYKNIVSDVIENFGNKPKKTVRVDSKKINDIIGNSINCSVTNLEKYNSCAFSYFARYVLKLKEKKDGSVNFANFGSVLHDVMDKFFKEIAKENKSFKEIDDIYIKSKLTTIVDKAIKTVDHGALNESVKNNFLKRKITSMAIRTVNMMKLHFIKGKFEPWLTEAEFGRENSIIKGIVFNLPNDRKIILNGIIDRVDRFTSDDGDFIRIVDYKTGGKSIEYYEIFEGLEMQLMTYLMTMLRCNERLKPGGVLYLTLKTPVVDIEPTDNKELIENKIRKKVRMNGIFLNDKAVLDAMDCDIDKFKKSDIIDITFDKQGEVSKDKALTYEEFEKLIDSVEYTIVDSAGKIYDGVFDINPANRKNEQACNYCPYGAICMFDKENGDFRNIKVRKKSELF